MSEVKNVEALPWGADTAHLIRDLEDYLRFCRTCGEAAAEEPGRGKRRREQLFPNLAGFFRWMGCGMWAAEELKNTQAELYDRICTVLEDEALNSELSPTVLSAYLKRRLGYGDRPEAAGGSAVTSAEGEQIRLIFDHDILEDGG
ncbi:MAG: hypothetical protein IJX62_01125 [Clostridia bacterium]|nr:hypothetical protein [Clostridia bacterium]